MYKNVSLVGLVLIILLGMVQTLTLNHVLEHNEDFISSNIVSTFEEMKKKHNYRYLTFDFNNDKSSIIIDKKGERDQDWDSFLTNLPYNKCKYAVYQTQNPFSTEKRSQRVFIFWMPATAKILDKILYSQSKDTLRRNLSGIKQQFVMQEQNRDISYQDFQQMFPWSD